MNKQMHRVLAWGLGVAGCLAGVVPAGAVQVHNASATGTIGLNSSSAKPFPSALVTTYAVTGNDLQMVANNVPLTTLGGAAETMFTPPVPTSTTGIQLQAVGAGCSFADNTAMTTSCTRGTLQVSFNRPVTNPVLHFVGLGSVRSITGDTTTITASRAVHTFLATIPSGLSMTVLPGATNLQTLGAGTSVDLVDANYNGTNCGSVTAPATQLGGCGSVRINGTVSSVTFQVDLAGSRNVYNNVIGNDLGDDGYLVTTSVDEDFGDAPASYDSVEAASHMVSGLRFGNTVDADNTTVFNNTPAITPSPNAVPAGADANGAAGDGADEDGLAALPVLHTGMIGQTYTLTPTLSGVTAGATVCGWIDFNRNGVFDTAEGTCTTTGIGATSASLDWTVPIATTAGRSYVRLRTSFLPINTATPNGRVDSGEVEDYAIDILPVVRVIKQLNPTNDPGQFQLRIGGTAFATAAGHNGTTNFRTLYHTGTPDLTVAQNIATTAITTSVGEVPAGGTNGTYSSIYTCLNGSGATVATGNGTNVNITLPVSVTGAAANGRAQAVTCSFTNTRVAATGTITIREDAVPDSLQTFSFTTTGTGLSNFLLDDNGDPALPSGRTFSGLAAGSYSVTQLAPPANWPAIGISCDDPGGTVIDPFTRTAHIDLAVDETVTCTYINALAQMTVVKSTPQTTISAPGTINYSIVVTNTGAAPLTGISLADTLPNGSVGALTLVQGDGNGNSVIDVGETWTYTGTYAATQADIDAGANLVNSVRVTTTQITSPVISSVFTTPVRSPSMSVTKTTPTTSINAPGTINYTITVANTGNVTLTGVMPVDTLPGGANGTVTRTAGDTNGNNALDVGETWTYTASYTATQSNVDAGTNLVNNVSVTTTQITTPVTGSATTTITRSPAMTVSKTTPTTSISAPGTINYTITVANTGNVSLTGVTPIDTLPGGANGALVLASGDTNTNNVLDVGESWTYTTSYAATQGDINAGVNLVNNVSVTTTQITTPVTSSATTTITQGAAMSVAKTTTSTTINAPGAINYTVVATNTGNVALTAVTPVDTLPGGGTGVLTRVSGDTNGNNQLDVGEAWTYTGSYTATQADIDAGTNLVNNVSVTSTQTATPVTGSATTTITRTPAMTVTKTTPQTSIGAPGTINYTIVVANTGNVSLTGVTPVDTLPGGANGALVLASGDTNTNSVLDVGESWTYTTSYAATQADINAATALVNNVSVTATQIATPVTASATTTIAGAPAMTVTKTTPTTSIGAPTTIAYSIVVTNTGNTALTGVTPVDTLPGGSNGVLVLASGDTNTNGVLDVAESWTYTTSYAATQADIKAGAPLVNHVSVTATQIATPVTASATTNVTQGAALSVTKTTPTTQIGAPGAILYTIAVVNTGNIALSGVTPVDTMPDGATGAVTFVSGDTDGDGQLDVGETWTYSASYAATQADIDAGTPLVNQVSVTSAQTATPVSASATTTIAQGPALSVTKTTPTTTIAAPGNIVYAVVVANTGNVALTNLAVVDTMPDGSNGVLTLTGGDTNANSVLDVGETWTYTTSFAVTANRIATGGSLVNTVSVTSVQTASAVSATASTVIAGAPAAAVPVPALGWLAWLTLLAGIGLVTLAARRRTA